MNIVVLDGRTDPHAGLITGAIAEALAKGDEQSQPADGLGTAPTGAAQSVMSQADAAVVLDPGSLVHAREAGTPFCAAVLPGFDVAWGGDLAEADLVIVAHERLVPAVVARGVPTDRVVVAGPVAPSGFAPAADRDALRRELGLGGAFPLVLVPAPILDEHGPEVLLVQLSLVTGEVGFLFDVGSDAEAAEHLRRLVPAHGLRAWMFADGPDSLRRWQAVDLVLCRTRGYEVQRALAVGSPLVLMPPGRSEVLAAEALESVGAARDADVLATLSVTLDGALEKDALTSGRRAIAELDVAESAGRIAAAVHAGLRRQSQAGAPASPRGLPHGLEPLGEGGLGDAPGRRSSRPPLDDMEARIERELQELKKRL